MFFSKKSQKIAKKRVIFWKKIAKKRVIFYMLKSHHSCYRHNCRHVPICKESYRRNKNKYFFHDFRKNPDFPKSLCFHFLKFFARTPISRHNWNCDFVTAIVTAFPFYNKYIFLNSHVLSTYRALIRGVNAVKIKRYFITLRMRGVYNFTRDL